MDRFSEMSEQRRIIEEKKLEIMKKFAEKKKHKKVIQGSSSKATTTTNIVTSSNNSFPMKMPCLSTSNQFKNDGSFLEQFKKMQESGPQDNSSESKKSNQDKPVGIVMKIASHQPQMLQPTAALEKLSSNDEEEKSNEERALKIAVEKVAISVAVNGEIAEEAARSANTSDPAYSFLNQPDGEMYKLYKRRVEDLVQAKKRAEADGHLMTFDVKNDSSNAAKKRKRRSRWDPEDSANDVNVMPKYVQQDSGLLSYAIQVFGTTDLTPEQWKQLEDQRKMRLLFEMMQAKQKEAELRKLTGKMKYEYDSDEETEGGTWEHKKRAMEMEKTRTWADDLTEKAKGKHHIGDFLPPDELENFLEKWDAVKQGRQPDLSDYKEYKIQSDNIGYKMLQKLGWTEGQGLGTDGAGIVEPVNKGVTPTANSGLGQTKPNEIKADDDEYEAYRKRMMLAYRFRPNPLNNPRRPYY